MSENCCEAPESVTHVYNYSMTADQFQMDALTVGLGLKVTCSELPASGGFFLVFLEGAPQKYGTDYTVDFDTGIITFVGATVGQTCYVIYIKA